VTRAELYFDGQLPDMREYDIATQPKPPLPPELRRRERQKNARRIERIPLTLNEDIFPPWRIPTESAGVFALVFFLIAALDAVMSLPAPVIVLVPFVVAWAWWNRP
jgi:hypothetical protein